MPEGASTMPSRRYCYWVRESSYGTAQAAPVLGTDALYLRLSEGAGFQMEEESQQVDIAYGGGRATLAEVISDQAACAGSLETNLYPAQAALLLGWAGSLVNTGRTTPWVTTDPSGVMPPGDLASASIFDVVQMDDGSYEYTRFSGV